MHKDAKKAKQQLSNSRLTTAAIFAFLPSFGPFGIHDFIAKQYSYGLLHIIIMVCALIAPVMTNLLFPNHLNWNQLSVIAYNIILMASYIWAIIEGINFLHSRRPPDASSTQWAISAYGQNSQPDSTEYGTEVSAETSTLSSKVKGNETARNEKEISKVWSILSFIFAIIPLFILAYCLIENSSTAFFTFFIFYYSTIGIPLSIMSIAFGFVGLKTKLRRLAIASLIIKIITISTILCLFFVTLMNAG